MTTAARGIINLRLASPFPIVDTNNPYPLLTLNARMEFFSQTYTALRGPTPQTQTAEETITKLSDRLSPATLLADRRAAVLALKGLSRDCKKEVGERALLGLLEVLYNDAEVDADIGKAVLETLVILCDTESSEPAAGSSSSNAAGSPIGPGLLGGGGVTSVSTGGISSKELGYKHSDFVLSTDRAVHALFALLADSNFYTRFATLQFLTTLLHNRRQSVQGYFLTAPAGPGSVLSVLEDKREIIRNEAIGAVQALTSQSPDIQKVLAFEGAFEKLFNIVTSEGGVDGGVVAQGALTCVDALLRFNTSNQSYFRETSLPPVLCALVQFPTKIELHDQAPQEFALQFWDEQKATNTSLIVGIMGMLVGSKGNNVPENSPFLRCLIETALASNAPTHLKTQCLRLIPPNINFPLSEISVTPYLPVPETNGEEWDRLEVASALDALVELAIHGEYNGLDAGKRSVDGLELRTAAVTVFENFVRKEEIKLAIVQSMLPPEGADPQQSTRITPLLHALISPPSPAPHLDPASVTSFHLSSMLFAHLLRSSSACKAAARQIIPGSSTPSAPPAQQTNNFFVPADGPPPPAPEPQAKEDEGDDDDDDENQTLIQILAENLTLSLIARSRADTSDMEARERDRYVVGYICLLIQWLWEDPKSVRAFLDAGGLGALPEHINQVTEQDAVVPGLCAFLLGVCYEFNREPGEITRPTIHAIINRLGPDNLVGQITRLREEDRFKVIGPDSIVLPFQVTSALVQPGSAKLGPGGHGHHFLHGHQQPNQPTHGQAGVEEGEIWFDWAFVDFWKSNYYTVQRGFAVPPDQLSSSAGQNAESAMLIASLREMINSQAAEIQSLQKQLTQAKVLGDQVPALQGEVESLKAKLGASENKCKEVEKEQEDLLVLLDEVTTKRKADKERLRSAGLEVSEDEGEDEEDDEED